MAERVEKKATGIYQRHRAKCKAAKGCKCPFQATVYSPGEGKLIRKQFAGLNEAKTWRQDAAGAVRAGTLKAPKRTTVKEAADALVAGMKDGSIFDRTGRPYKPSTVRSYEQCLTSHVLPVLGHLRLDGVERGHVQDLIEQMHGNGFSASTIRNVVCALQVICRRAVRRGELTVDPTRALDLPTGSKRRDRIETPASAATLIEALPQVQRAFWATAFYAGLRRGELRGLRWVDVDFDESLLRVERGWDDVEGPIDPKSDAGGRTVPLAGPLRVHLAAHKLQTGRSGDDLVFGRTATLPFTASTVRARALKAWGWKQEPNTEPGSPRMLWVKAREDALEPLTAHEARHCCASYLIAAGLNAKELSVYLGHADIRITYNRYGHLMPGGEREAAETLTTFLAKGATS
jgi:integrase